MKIDFSASIVTGGGIRSRIEEIRTCYNESCAAYFDDLLSKSGKSFGESGCGFLLFDSLLQKHGIDRAELGLKIEQGGRPRTDNSSLDFSISHSEGCVMCVIAMGEGFEVGCDIQREREYSDEKLLHLAKAFMSADELDSFRVSNQKRADFFTAWTKREAYCKRVGADIFENMKSTDFVGGNYREGVISAVGNRYYYAICGDDNGE